MTPKDPRRRDPAADSSAAEAADTPAGAESLATPPVNPAPESTGRPGPGYGDATRVNPAAQERPDTAGNEEKKPDR